MSHQSEDDLGRLDDVAEEREQSSTTDGAAAEGDYDPAQGSPGGAHAAPHPVGEDFPAEAARYDEPKHRRPD